MGCGTCSPPTTLGRDRLYGHIKLSTDSRTSRWADTSSPGPRTRKLPVGGHEFSGRVSFEGHYSFAGEGLGESE